MTNKLQNYCIAVLSALAIGSCGQKEAAQTEGQGTEVALPSENSTDIRKPENGEVFTIGFYNVENLFDTEDDPKTRDEDFLPSNKEKPWTVEIYNTKKKNLAEVIAKMGDADGPEILGLCEVENKKVLEDLVAEEMIKGRNYGIVHRESSDGRGIDNALIYKKDCFKPTKVTMHVLKFPTEPNYRSRDIMLVRGDLFGEPIAIMVNHWPSRRGGMEKSEPKRLVAASKVRSIIEDLKSESPNLSIFIMGDFNDEPSNKSLATIGAVGMSGLESQQGDMFNAMYELDQQGKGSYKYRSDWNMLDQIILSPALMDGKGLEYRKGSATVFGPEWLKQQKPAKYKGSPLRTYGGRKYLGGYSDHFPVFVEVEMKSAS